MTDHQIWANEISRIAFVRMRDGPEECKAWMQRTIHAYRAALRTGYGKAYRRSLLLSVLTMRRALRS